MEIVALDARLTRQMSTGMKLYVRQLVERLPRIAPDLSFVVVSNVAFQLAFPNARVVCLSEAAAANGGFAEQFGLGPRLADTGATLVHFMSVYAPRASQLPHVYTIHDLIHLRYPHYFSWKVPHYYRWVVKRVARTARAVITDALVTVADLEAFLSVSASKVRVVPLAATADFYLTESERLTRAAQIRKRLNLERPYFLYAGNHRPHKNLALLVDAWSKLEAACDLVITEEGPLGVIAATAKNNGRLILTGHVSQDDLINLYAGCSGAVQPSFYEGFGLALLEAMAAGAPSVIAQTPALVELGGQAVVSFPPTDAGALRGALKELLNDTTLQERLRTAGRDRAQNFSWDETARQTAGVYREALSAHA